MKNVPGRKKSKTELKRDLSKNEKSIKLDQKTRFGQKKRKINETKVWLT